MKVGFKEDLKLEERFYNEIFKPWLSSRGKDSIFIHFDANNIVYESLQKKHDIDIILDNGKQNMTISLKTVRREYNNIFFETVSNTTKNTEGWGYYSKADWIVYSMGNFEEGFTGYLFQIKDILKLNISEYPVRYGYTRNYDGDILYKTEGRLIPLRDFKHKKVVYPTFCHI